MSPTSDAKTYSVSAVKSSHGEGTPRSGGIAAILIPRAWRADTVASLKGRQFHAGHGPATGCTRTTINHHTFTHGGFVCNRTNPGRVLTFVLLCVAQDGPLAQKPERT